MSVTITTSELMEFEGTRFGQTLALLQGELDISIYTGGDGSIEITFGPNLLALANLSGGTVPTSQDLFPFEVAGFRELVNDVHLSRIFASWSSAFGGSLLLRAVLEEEGTEIRGGLDFDLKHLELQLYLVPSLDPAGEVRWDVKLDLEIDGNAVLDSFRERLKEEILGSGIAALIGDSLGPVVDQLNFLLGLDEITSVGSIRITDDEAVFEPAPPGGRRVAVYFDAVDVHDDSDWPGQGELSFRPTVQGFATEYSEEVSAASGSLIPLVGEIFSRVIVVPEDTPLDLRFEARDRETIGRDETLGTVAAELPFDTLARSQTRQLRSDRGDYTLHLRVVPTDGEDTEGARHLAVALSEVQVLRDQDTFGKGEVQFFAVVNGTPTPVSAEVKAAGTQDPVVEPRDDAGRPLSVELYLPEDATLDVRVVGWDNDPSQRDDMGEATLSVGIDEALAGSPHELEASTRDFVATVTVSDLDALPAAEVDPDDPDPDEEVVTVPRTVVFEGVDFRRDGDTLGAGDIVVTGTVQGRRFRSGDPIKVSRSGTLPLIGAGWRADVEVPVDGELEVSVQVTDIDGRVDDGKQDNDDDLGTASATFGAARDHGLGAHAIEEPEGFFTARFRVLDPNADTGAVAGNLRLEEVVIHRDHTALAKGKFWCQASIDGWPIDDSEKFKAGRGDSIVLDSAAWQRGIWVDEGAEATLRFEVFEANDNDHASIGVVRAGVGPPWPDGPQSVDADSGDFTLRYRAWTPASEAPNRVRVLFEEVQVLDDGDVSSEGELFFLGAANAERTGLSTLHKAKRGETVKLQASQWALEVGLERDDALTIEFTSYDDDREALEALGTLRATFRRSDKWGLGEHLLTAPSGAFRLRVRIEPADADSVPDLPGLRELEVGFASVLIHDDGDDHSNGEITFEASLMGQPVMVSPEYKVSPGDRVYLAEGSTPRKVWVDDGDTLEVGLSATERDNARVDALGSARASHTVADDFGAGQRRMEAGNGAFEATYEVSDAGVPRLLVKFLQVHVLDDHEWLGRGEIVCEAVANGIGTGPSERMKAGSDNPNRPQDDLKSDVFLGGPKWRKKVPVDPEAPSLTLRFTVVEKDGLSRDDLLGTVDLTLAGDALLGPTGRRIHEVRADTGRFDLVFLTQMI